MQTPKPEIEQQLLGITHALLTDLHNIRALAGLSLTADLEKQLGIGSIEKAELFLRIEQNFGIQLPEALLTQVDTLQDLVKSIQEAHPYAKPVALAHFPKIPRSQIDPSKANTLYEVLDEYAQHEADRPHIFLQNDRGEERIISYGLLSTTAKKVAGGLQKLGLKPNQTVAIMLPTSEEFFYAFFGVLIAGGIPVPIYPPLRANKLEEYIQRERKILCNAQSFALISFHEVSSLNNLLKSFVPLLKHITTVRELLELEVNPKLAPRKSADGALIQYTSGSTGDPKGVFLTNQNLLANIRAFGEAIGIQPTDVVVSWLPLYHDMGLIGTWLGSLYHGLPIVILSPMTFLTHPEKWLWAIHYHQATITASPNFGYELCLSKIPSQNLVGLDLSSWRVAFNGAEAVYPSTLRNFAKRFSKYGLKPNVIRPVYGLAEASVALTIPNLEKETTIDKIKRDHFDKEQRAVPATKLDTHSLEFVSCGTPISDHEIRIIDDQGNTQADRIVGHLQFKGPSAMQGYYLRPDITQEIYHDGWLDTGDYAYTVDGELFITGREKDVIITAGRNLYPAEIEEIVGDISDVRKGCVVAFGAYDQNKGTEQFTIVAESHKKDPKIKNKISNEIVDKVATNLGIPPDKIIIVPPGTILKTSSGKLRRNSTKEAYLKGKLTKKSLPATLQYLKLKLSSFISSAKNKIILALKLIYTLYFTSIGVSTGILTWLIAIITPPKFSFYLLKAWSRMLLFLGFCPIQYDKDSFPKNTKPIIFVANHASYMDSALLVATLPKDILIVGKKELLAMPFIKTFVNRLKYPTVDRLDFSKSIEDTKIIKNALLQKKSILIFAEGTFTSATGLRPFKLGAFKLAAETMTAICPIAIRGTRQLLRANQFIFIPSKLSIWIGDPVVPQTDDFDEAIRLRNELRKIISTHCGEPLLQLVRAGVP